MLPGKKYKPEDIVEIAWRRKWFIVIPFILVACGTMLVSRILPDLYRSSTLILLVPQRVPESYVRSTVTARIEDRLQTISQQIMSRTRLERVILEFNLYARERQRGIMEDVVEQMRKDIRVDVVRGDAFTVSYVSESPLMAQKVADRLSQMFMDESRMDRELMAQSTTDFLQNQLDEARRQLTEQEQRLAQYQRQHAGELPTERESTLQVLNNTQMQVQQIIESINRDRDRRYLIEKVLAELETDAAAPPLPAALSVEDPSAMAGVTTAQRLELAKAQLRSMELRLTPEHADVKRMKRVIADLEAKVQAETLQQPVSPGAEGDKPASPEAKQRADRIKGARIEIDALDRQIQAKEADEQRLRKAMAALQARLDVMPNRESELTALTRDYQTLQRTYENLLAKQQDSKVAENLERRQIGEQFKTLDQARLPEKPFSPNRPFINLLGAIAGLGLGVGLVGLLEYRDSSFRVDDEVVSVLSLPVLAVVPLMTTAAERRRTKRRKVRVLVATATTFVLAVVVLVWQFDLWNRVMRRLL